MRLFSKAKLRSLVPTLDPETDRELLELEYADDSDDEDYEPATYDVFLSHKFEDTTTIGDNDLFRLLRVLKGQSLSVFVDLLADRWPDRKDITKPTADWLRSRMDKSQSLLYVVSTNSSKSRWMPWELGYVDVRTGLVAVVPINDQDEPNDTYDGPEYLGIYPFVTIGTSHGQQRIWIRDTNGRYCSIQRWLKGEGPF